MDHLIAGELNPKVLAQLARARARRKISQQEEALEGAEFFTRCTPRCWPPCSAASTSSAEIFRLSQVMERLLAPWGEQLQQAESMPGWGAKEVG
jgi:transposase